MAIQGNTTQSMSPLDEELASLLDVTKRRSPGDGTEPGGTGQVPKGGADAQDIAPQTADEKAATPAHIAPVVATLEDADRLTKFKTLDQLVRSQDRLARNRWAIDLHYDSIRSGVSFSRLEKIPNQSVWVRKLPNGMTKEASGATPNKADDLCNKVEDTLMADPPKPDPEKRTNEESARAGSEMAREFLVLNGGESGTNDPETYRWALNNAFSRSASFVHYWVDRTGGGYQPLQKLAHPQAQDPATPLIAMVPAPPDALTGQPAVDPMTGQPAMIPVESPNPVLRYVSAPTPEAPAGQFVQSAEEADRVWLPKIIAERMRREQVRCFPPDRGPEHCDALILLRSCTLAELRDRYPETVGQMGQAELIQLASWKPPTTDLSTLPFALRGLSDASSGPSLEQVGSLSPVLQRRVYTYLLYVKAGPDYKNGYWLEMNGANGGTELGEGTLDYAVTVPREGKVTRCRDIPVTMVRPLQDVSGGDAMGWPLIARFAGASEAEATIWAAALDMVDNMLHPHVFLRSNTAIDDDDWANRTQPIVLGPEDAEPTYERFPPFPPVLPMVDTLGTKMDVSSGLTGTAQGLDSANAVSGIAKQLTVRQALISLSGFQQNLHAAMCRGWRIVCQIVQAEWTTPQLVDYSGEEASSEPEWWTGEDFAGVDRIGIQPGTGSMMTPEGKAQYTAFLQGQGWLLPDAAAEVAMAGVRLDLGIPENPAEAAIERSVGVWLKGPSSEWIAAKQQENAATQLAQQQYQAQLPALTQQYAAVGQAPPPFQAQPSQLATPFPPRPNDDEPAVATATVKRLSKLMFDPRYAEQPPEWRQVVDETYQRARGALQAQALAAQPQQAQPGKSEQPKPQASPGNKPMPKMPSIAA